MKQDINKGFIEQTAHDYDLPYHIVEKIYILYYPKQFYEELERALKEKSE